MEGTKVTMTAVNNRMFGEIVSFDVVAYCPYCTNDTDVSQDALSSGLIQCQHCDEEFKVLLGD